MPIEVVNAFAAIGSVCLLLILLFCFFCGLKQISEWADAIHRDKQRRERGGRVMEEKQEIKAICDEFIRVRGMIIKEMDDFSFEEILIVTTLIMALKLAKGFAEELKGENNDAM